MIPFSGKCINKYLFFQKSAKKKELSRAIIEDAKTWRRGENEYATYGCNLVSLFIFWGNHK
jgi:hypothetical protein